MASPSVPPLRYQKGGNGSSPHRGPMPLNRPLSEISPMAVRRNSPSFPQAKNAPFKHESSPANSSPFGNGSVNSPHLFWQQRDAASPSRENQRPADSVSPKKRSSIENLKRASRVKNSSMFAKEQQNNYDPARPGILDGRPLGSPVHGNALQSRASELFERNSCSASNDKSLSANELATRLSPSKLNMSPTKSSLSKKTGARMRSSGFDPDSGIWEDDDDEERKLPEGRGLHRHAKSVTFDQAPPQINEYEMTTPDPSSVASGSREGSYDSFGDEEDDGELSFERGSSMDHDDSFDASLEDTDKTPVVLPEDWRFMSPETANTDLVHADEDVFEDDVGSPAPNAEPGRANVRAHQASLNSTTSDGQSRPLPPLPPNMAVSSDKSRAQNSLSGTIERMSSGQRALPSPPPAATLSKSDLRRMSRESLSLEDRLRLMMLNENHKQTQSGDSAQGSRQSRQIGSKTTTPVRAEKSASSADEEPNQNSPSRLSRSSILQQLRDDQYDDHFEDEAPERKSSYDPDVPIPSLEDPTQRYNHGIVIKEEEIDDNELYAIPDMYSRLSDTTSHASQESHVGDLANKTSDHTTEPGIETPRAQTPVLETTRKHVFHERISLPDFADFGENSSFNLDMSEYITPPSERTDTEKPLLTTPVQLPDLEAIRKNIEEPRTPEEVLEPPKLSFSGDESSADPGTPNSVIRHDVSLSPEAEVVDEELAMREEALQDQCQHEPTLPGVSSEEIKPEETRAASDMTDQHALEDTTSEKRVSSLVQLEIAANNNEDGGLLGLEQEFDRVVEAQKRGYLMRQNTKVVVASERALQETVDIPTGTEVAETSAPETAVEPNEVRPSSRKASQPTWTAEPWNGKSRRRSIRVGGEKATARRKMNEGPVPPLPGQQSAVQDNLGAVVEDEIAEEEAEEFEDGVERGRLFVKVVGVKDLQLPFPSNERTYFALTLDNGIHCVTTAWLDLGKNAAIGQEFELVVLNDLEFQLTLQMKLEQPEMKRAPSPSKIPTSPKKQGAFGRLFGSPKKKKESDQRVSQEVKRPVTPPSAYELVQGLVAKDGSFARAYVSLSEHEKQAYGRPYQVDIKCFNEWAMEEVSAGSSRSKKAAHLQNRPPYEIGTLELQLLYVPKPKGAKDEDMPKSMNSAIRTIREAEERMRQQANIKNFEGYLSQQGGDCPYWRRRFFKLVGSKLTAYHEATLQPRATINLNKANKLIDDKSSLTQKETSTKGGGRRKSAFADDEEGYMFIEEGFRIRFGNGEVIDFYADSSALKEEWMQALCQVVGKNVTGSTSSIKGWAEMVLKREKTLKAKAQVETSMKKAGRAPRQHEPLAAHVVEQAVLGHTSSVPVPAAVVVQAPRRSAHARTESYQDQSGTKSQATSPVKSKISPAERRAKARSMAI